jgi:hypothetical protein
LLAQKNALGIQVAPYYSKIYQSSESEIVILHGESKILGLNLGAFYHLNFTKFQIRNSVDVQQKLYFLQFQDEARNVDGNIIGLYLCSVGFAILRQTKRKGNF